MPGPARTKKEHSATPPSDDAEIKSGKRKRQSQSCDACRARKVRCARENPDDQKQSCKHCISLQIPCTYEYQPKKRGPPNLYLRRRQEEEALASAKREQNGRERDVVEESALSPVASSPTLSILSPTLSKKAPFIDTNLAVPPSVPIPPSRYPIAADQYHPHYPSAFRSNDPHSNGSIGSPRTEDSYSSPDFNASSYTLYNNPHNASNWSYRNPGPAHIQSPHTQHVASPHSFLPPNILPPLSHNYRPHRLDSIAPRDTISLIIALFFDFVYPLTPCIHKPSFMADLHARREERDPLFFALVMSTVASTLVQVPRSYLPMERPVVRRLAQTCYEASRHITVASYDPPTSMHVVIRYFDCVYHFCEGHDATQHAAFGEAAHIAVTLRMHEESSYEGLDPIECEIRRRCFWLLFDADKSMAILLGRPICLRDEDCTVHFPKELDDEYITPSAYLPQPHGKTALVSGLNYISRIFALLGEILVRIRVDKRSPPQGQFATARLEEVQSLHTRIMAALSHAPEPLRLKPQGVMTHHQANSTLGMGLGAGPNGATGGLGGLGALSLPPEYGGAGFRQATFAEVKDFFDNPNASRANALNPCLVMQANLYVTQQLVRFVIEQYRDELLLSLQGSLDENQVAEDRESVASDLLVILHSIPIQSIATNGPSLVHKVRFVASTLLDAVSKAEIAPGSAARAHGYLWDFLSILSEIERNYLLDDDRDGSSSADGMMLS